MERLEYLRVKKEILNVEWLEYRRVVTENCTESLEYLRGGTVILEKERLRVVM